MTIITYLLSFPLFSPHNPWILRSITILNFITMNTVNTQKLPLVISFSKSIMKFKIKKKMQQECVYLLKWEWRVWNHLTLIFTCLFKNGSENMILWLPRTFRVRSKIFTPIWEGGSLILLLWFLKMSWMNLKIIDKCYQ